MGWRMPCLQRQLQGKAAAAAALDRDHLLHTTLPIHCSRCPATCRESMHIEEGQASKHVQCLLLEGSRRQGMRGHARAGRPQANMCRVA